MRVANAIMARLQARYAQFSARRGHLERAVRGYQAALARDDRNPVWHFRLGRLHERSGRWECAAGAYEAALARDDRNPRWHYRLARVRSHMEKWTAAGHAYGEALARDPGATALDRALLADSPRAFETRTLVGRFVPTHLDEIRRGALTTQPAPGDTSPRIFVYWAQGIHNAPAVVRRCHQELLRHHSPDEVVVLDQASVPHWVRTPAHVLARTASDPTKYSDVLRLELLSRYGGVWLDATCLPRTRLLDLVPELTRPGFFAFNYRRTRISTWFLASEPGNYLMSMLREAQYKYWEQFDRAVGYYFFHHLFEALYHLDDDFRAGWDGSLKMSADPPHEFQRVMHQPFDPVRYRQLLDGCFVHKLTHKCPAEVVSPDTLMSRLVRDGVPAGDAPRDWLPLPPWEVPAPRLRLPSGPDLALEA